jgi:zinc/manganese transport system substrate-binding protein
VVVASARVRPRPTAEGSAADPHAWQDVANGRAYVRAVSEALVAALPDQAPALRRRAEEYDERLAELDDWVRQQLASVPADRRVMVIPHEAFGYFGTAYGVTVLSLERVSTESEPSPRQLARLSRQIRDRHIRALFVEPMEDDRLMRQLARESGVPVAGTLYADTLSPSGGPAASYVAMVRYNVDAMVRAMREE